MSQKKQLFNSPWISSEIEALQSEKPDPNAIDRAVLRTMRQSPERVAKRLRSPLALRITFAVAGIAALSLLSYTTLQPASAASLHEIANALRGKHTRHTIDSRPDENGKLTFRGELWADGRKHAEIYDEPNRGIYRSGYDGAHMFMATPHGAFVDDVQDGDWPVEDIDAYLNNPYPKTVSQKADVEEEGRTVDLYQIGFSNVKFNLYVDPATRLPIRRDVFSTSGRLTEQEHYDYPSSIPDNIFEPPKVPGMIDYPRLRTELAARLKEPGQTKEVGGVKITLKAVILGQGKVIALWTGGAKGENTPEGVMWIENQERAPLTARPDAFTVAHRYIGVQQPQPPVIVGKEQVLGDAAWLLEGGTNRHTYIQGPFTINVPVWAEDRTRPISGKKGEVIGYHSKLAGRLTFDITDPIRADDPDRVIWRPSGDPVATGTANEKP